MRCILKRESVEFVNKEKETVKGYNYFLEFENGEVIYIEPVFKKESKDFIRLRAFSDKVEK